MVNMLRGGLALASSGFGFWRHDIGDCDGTPDAGVFKRSTAFGTAVGLVDSIDLSCGLVTSFW